MKLLLASDELIVKFAYWNGCIHLGMCYADELFEYVSSFSSRSRLGAYSAGAELLEKGATVCITVAKDKYSVWRSLRNPESEFL